MRLLAALVGIVLFVTPALGEVVLWDQLTPLDSAAAPSWRDLDAPNTTLTLDDFQVGLEDSITAIDLSGYSAYGSERIESFRITIFGDVPATPDDAAKPDLMDFVYDYTCADWTEVEPGRFRVSLPEDQWIPLEAGKIYWIGIQGVMIEDFVQLDEFYWTFRERTEPTWGGDAAFGSESMAVPPWANWGCPPGYGEPEHYEGPLPEGWTSLDMSFRLIGIPEPASLLLAALGMVVLRRR